MGVKLVIERARALHEALKLEYNYGVNALGSDRYSNPVQMVVEGWLCLEFLYLMLFLGLTQHQYETLDRLASSILADII